MNEVVSKRKFLIATSDETRRQLLTHKVTDHVDRVALVSAEDGLQAMQKIQNDQPDILIADSGLTKLSTHDLIASLLYKNKTLAIILITDDPDPNEFSDALVTGQLQFLFPEDIEKKVGVCLARAVNWLKRGDTLEFTMKFVASGEYLMRQGEKAESVYILKRGSMKAFVRGASDNADNADEVASHGTLLGEISPKEFVGEMAYINGDVRSADVIAETDCELIEIPIRHLDRLLFQKPAWAMALMKTLSKRMKIANDQRISD